MDKEKRVLKFLLVEDDPDFRSVMERLIMRYAEDRGFGAKILSAAAYREAKEVLEHETVDIAISDYRLAEGPTGLEFKEYCSTEFPSIPFILMSGQPGEVFEGLLSRGEDSGHYLTKPFKVLDCRKIIDEALRAAVVLPIKIRA